MSELSTSRSKLFILLCAGVILPVAFLFSVLADYPHVLLLALLGILYSLFSGRVMPYGDRSIIYLLLFALMLSLIFEYIFPLAENRFGLVGDIFQIGASAPLLIYLAVLITLYASNVYVLGFCCSFCLGATMLSGDIISRNIENVRMPYFNFLMAGQGRMEDFYYTVVVIEIIFILLLLQLSGRHFGRVKSLDTGLKLKRLCKILAFLMIPLVAWGGVSLLDAYRHELRKLEIFFVRLGSQTPARGDKVLFSHNIDLNRTTSWQVKQNDALVILRSVGAVAPGYLRGMVYTHYSGGRWVSSDNDYLSMNMVNDDGALALKSFYFTDSEPYTKQYHIYPSTSFTGKTLFVPGNSSRIEAIAERLLYSKSEGSIRGEHWKSEGGYSISVKDFDQESAYALPDNPTKYYKEKFTQIPEDIRDVLGVVLDDVFATWKIDRNANDRQVITVLTSWFLDEFEYKLGVRFCRDIDPVMEFLEKTKKGHCELFASSMVLLLRKHGIPARYITGFVCSEMHPSGRYSVARLGNAHAWVEAYIREENRWVLVEPTPPSGVPTANHEWGEFEAWNDGFKQFFQELLSDLRRGYFAKAMVSIFSTIFALIWQVLRDPLRGSVAIVLLLLFAVYKIIKRVQSFRERTIYHSDAAVTKLIFEFHKLEKVVAKKTGKKRELSSTVEQWRKTVCLDSSFTALDEILCDYQKVRYTPDPDNEEVLRIIKKIRHTSKVLRTNN